MNEPLPVRIPWEYQGARPAGDLTQHTWTWRNSYLVELRDSLQNVQRRWIVCGSCSDDLTDQVA